MKKKILNTLLYSLYLAPIAIVSSCQNTSNPTNNNDLYLNQYINNLTPPKFNEKDNTPINQILASSLNSEDLLKKYFTNLPESKNGINVKYVDSKPKPNDSTTLVITYEFTYENVIKNHSFEINGFKSPTEAEITDEVIIQNFIKTLDPKLKPSKEQDKKNTFAKDINTETKVEEWFDNLPKSDNSKEISVKFISSNPDNKDSSNLNIKYNISRNSYQAEYSYFEYGFKSEDIITPIPPNPETNIKFQITLKRPNGNIFYYIKPPITIKNTNGSFSQYIDSESKDNWFNGSIKIDLPEDEYIIELPTLSDYDQYYTFDKQFKMNPQNPNLDIILNPKNLQNISFPATRTEVYKTEQVLYKSEYKDVLGSWLSLKSNMEKRKITVFMFMRTSCQYCNATFPVLSNLKKDTNYKNKFDIWAFSDTDELQLLKNYANYKYPNINFIEDKYLDVRSKFYNSSNRGVPRLVFIDSEGVLVNKISGAVYDDAILRQTIDKYYK